MFKDRISALPDNAGAGLPSARAAVRSCNDTSNVLEQEMENS